MQTGQTYAHLRNVTLLLELVERISGFDGSDPAMGCFFGPTGFGKTVATTFAEISYEAVVIELRKNNSAKDLFRKIAFELSLSVKGTTSALFDRVAEELISRPKPIIIDEADYLIDKRMVDDVRDLFNTALVPIVLVGEEELPQKLNGWPRTAGRIESWVGALPACLKDVSELAGIYAPGIAISEELQREILKASGGALRIVKNNLKRVNEFAAVQGVQSVGLAEANVVEFVPTEAPKSRDQQYLRSAAS